MGMKIEANLSAQPIRQNTCFKSNRYSGRKISESKDTFEFSGSAKKNTDTALNKFHTILAATLLAYTTSCTKGNNDPQYIDTSVFNEIPEYMLVEEPSKDTPADSVAYYDDFSDLDSLAAQYPIDDCDGMAKTIQQIDSVFNSMSREEQDKFLEFLIDEVRAEKAAEEKRNN